MAKFHGVIGYVQITETAPGVHTEDITERACTGDILRNTQRWEQAQTLNDNVSIDNRFSIIGDEFSHANLQNMRYITYMGSKWKVKSIEILRPRIIITVGGVYNG